MSGCECNVGARSDLLPGRECEPIIWDHMRAGEDEGFLQHTKLQRPGRPFIEGWYDGSVQRLMHSPFLYSIAFGSGYMPYPPEKEARLGARATAQLSHGQNSLCRA